MEDLDGLIGPASIDVSFCSNMRRIDHFHDAIYDPIGIKRMDYADTRISRLLCLRSRDFKASAMAIHQTPRPQ